jgi:hypothetical protein
MGETTKNLEVKETNAAIAVINETEEECLLQQHVLDMLQVSWKEDTTKSKELANLMNLSPRSVDTYFGEAMDVLVNIHTRGGVITRCAKRGWIGEGGPITVPRHTSQNRWEGVNVRFLLRKFRKIAPRTPLKIISKFSESIVI